MKRRGWWQFAVLLVLGVVLSPLRAAAATIPVLFAYDVAVRPTATTVVGRYEAARSEAERPAFNDYDCALVGYGDHSNPPVVRDERADDAYDRAPNLPERCEVGGGVIYDAPAPTAATEEGTTAFRAFNAGNFRANLARLTGGIEEGSQAHHVFPQKFAYAFARLGINIDDPAFGAWWNTAEHASNSGAYNAAWAEFFAAGDRTAAEAMQFGRDLAFQYGFTVHF